MCACWNFQDRLNESQINSAIDEIKGIVSLNSEGRLQSTGLKFKTYPRILSTNINFDEKYSVSTNDNLVKEGIEKCLARQNGLDAKSLIAEVSKSENKYKRKKKRKFYLVTSISMRLPGEVSIRRQINGCYITISNARHPKFCTKKIDKSIKQFIGPEPPSRYADATILVEARSESDAALLALNALNLLRGCWSYSVTYHKGKIFQQGYPQPITPFSLGPIQTLHKHDGSLAMETFWYDESYRKPRSPRSLTIDDLRRISAADKKIRKLLRTSRYHEWLTEGFRRYAEILDEPIASNLFPKLWSLLEYLTQTKYGKNKTVIRRVMYIHKDEDILDAELNYLKLTRNSIVHNIEDENIDSAVVYQLKNFVDSMLEFYLMQTFPSRGLKEIASILEEPFETHALTSKIDDLKKKLSITKTALEYRKQA